MQNRAGSYKANFSGELEYKSFVPSPLPPVPGIAIDSEMAELLVVANRNLGILEGISKLIPDIELFVSMYVRKEALLSSQIEGTQATMDDILDPKLPENMNRHVAEVVNYIKASQYARDRLHDLPICNRLIKEVHQVLMENLRGDEKYPGEFRRSQNWIGPAGSTLKDARYIPPAVEDMLEAMSDLGKFINAEDHIDPLIKIALIHYQFETIHPFLDGNGRIGRLLVNLFLMDRKILSHETLYISYFLKRNRVEYYDRLTEVRNRGDYEQWVAFFLRAISESAADSIDTAAKLADLRTRNLDKISAVATTSKTPGKIFNYLESHPIIDITKTSQDLGLAYNTVSKGVQKLIDLGILVQSENVLRNRVFAYEEYLSILRKDT